MKNKTIIMLTVAAIAMLTSCVGAEIVEIDDGNKVSFTDGTFTRASGTAWEAGDQIGVTMYNEAKTAVINSYNNYRYDVTSAGTNGAFTPKSGEMYFPGNDKTYFVAYSPYNASYTATIPINTTTPLSMKELMWTGMTWDKATDGKVIPLKFNYKLAKVIIKLTAGEGLPSLSKNDDFIFAGYSQGDLDIKTGVITTKGTVGAVGSLGELGNDTYYCYFIPQKLEDEATIELSLAGGYVVINLGGMVLKEGMEYNYAVTVNKGKTSLSSLTITGRTSENLTQEVDVQ